MHVSGLIDLGLTPTGEMEVPADAVTAGWFDLGPTPGELGPAVIAAHVNYEKVPGLFARLHEIAVGDAIAVTRVDGSTVRRSSPTAWNGSRSRHSRPRTSTATPPAPSCGSSRAAATFDRASGDYRDNVVVFARSA